MGESVEKKASPVGNRPSSIFFIKRGEKKKGGPQKGKPCSLNRIRKKTKERAATLNEIRPESRKEGKEFSSSSCPRRSKKKEEAFTEKKKIAGEIMRVDGIVF